MNKYRIVADCRDDTGSYFTNFSAVAASTEAAATALERMAVEQGWSLLDGSDIELVESGVAEPEGCRRETGRAYYET